LGWTWFVGIVAMLSLQVGLINLFPIPALDGSRAAFLIIEGIRRRPLDPRKEALVHVMGFMLLILVMLLLTYHDILFYARKQ
jgi:regulator of sigma E protease